MPVDRILKEMFDAAVEAADPRHTLSRYLNAPPPVSGKTVILGAGKAAASMSVALESIWEQSGMLDQLSGLVVTRYAHGLPTKRIEVLEAGHPVPDAEGLNAARRILSLAQGLGEEDHLICLLSGGGSSLLTLPPDSIPLEDKRWVNKELLRCGAAISEINTVRKHLSAIKGGRLAVAAYPAKVTSFLISDVPNDEVSVIASGPTVPDSTTCDDALKVLADYKIQSPQSVRDFLAKADSETPKPGHQAFARCTHHTIATPQDSLEAAARVARENGLTPIILGDLEGEARDVALVHASIARQIKRHHQPISPPAVILSGGETTVTVRGNGRGGRNAEFLTALLNALGGESAVAAIACDTDGIDGTEDNAGAWFDDTTHQKAISNGLSPDRYLANNDGYGLFDALGHLIITGPTRTNVNDFRAVIVGSKQE